MTARFGIDTSILVRLATSDPEDGFEHCVCKLTTLIERDDAEVFASNHVIGEAYIALQHHYGVSKPDARAALASVLKSGPVAPPNGAGVFADFEASTGCGLLDRLVVDDYRRAELITLTLERKMGALPPKRRITCGVSFLNLLNLATGQHSHNVQVACDTPGKESDITDA